MAYDQELSDRIRGLIGSAPDLTEKKMFGGLAFLISGRTEDDLAAWVDTGVGYARSLKPKQ
jgi:hypothetical protein